MRSLNSLRFMIFNNLEPNFFSRRISQITLVSLKKNAGHVIGNSYDFLGVKAENDLSSPSSPISFLHNLETSWRLYLFLSHQSYT